MNWNENKPGGKKPSPFIIVEVRLQDDNIVKAYFLKDINKYIRKVNRWRIIGNGNYIPDEEVVEWRYLTERIKK